MLGVYVSDGIGVRDGVSVGNVRALGVVIRRATRNFSITPSCAEAK